MSHCQKKKGQKQDKILTICISCLFRSFFDILLIFIIVVSFESILRNFIQQKSGLVWILKNQVLSLRKFHAYIDDTSKDTPCIIHVQIDLICKLSGLELFINEEKTLEVRQEHKISDFTKNYLPVVFQGWHVWLYP